MLPHWARFFAGVVFYSQAVTLLIYVYFTYTILGALAECSNSDFSLIDILSNLWEMLKSSPASRVATSSRASRNLSYVGTMLAFLKLAGLVAQFAFWGFVAHFKDQEEVEEFVRYHSDTFHNLAKIAFAGSTLLVMLKVIYELSI